MIDLTRKLILFDDGSYCEIPSGSIPVKVSKYYYFDDFDGREKLFVTYLVYDLKGHIWIVD